MKLISTIWQLISPNVLLFHLMLIHHSINQIQVTVNQSPEPPFEEVRPSPHTENVTSFHSTPSTYKHTPCSPVSVTRFDTLFTSDLVSAALIWLPLAPVHCFSLLISQHGRMAGSQSDPSLCFFSPPLYLSHWWELDATPPAVPVSSLIGVWYSAVVISRGRTRGCHSSWLL